MEGQRQMGKPLQLLITLSLFILTNQFEVRGDVLEKLSFDTAAELHLRGTSDSEIQELQEILSGNSLINQQFLLQKDLDAVLNKQQMEDQWRSVSESSPSFRQEVLVLTGSKDSSDGRMRQESSLDPQKRVPVFLYDQSCLSELDSSTGEETFTQNQQTGSGCSGSSDSLTMKIKPEMAADFSNHGNTTLNSGVILFKASMVHGPIEPDQENPQIYRGIQEPDPVPGSRRPQRPDDPVQLQILMLEDDEVVRTSAASLYAKHPAVSSVHVVDPQQRVHQVKGQPVVLSEHSSLVLVGHGARDRSGEMRISGYTSKDVARIIQNSSRISQKIQTTTVVACEAGSDQRFREALLKELHEAGIETELHLWTAVVQVTESGEVISQDVSADGAQWRSGDDTKKVVLTVGSNGEIRRRKETDHRGREVLTNQTRLLGGKKDKRNPSKDVTTESPKTTVNPRFLEYRKSWPTGPKIFINQDVFNKVDQNNVDKLKQTFRDLEGLTWGLFYPEPTKSKPDKVDINEKKLKTDEYVIGKRENGNIIWLEEQNGIKEVLSNCYVIKSGSDVHLIIRHFAKEGEDETKYLMVNNWIYEVNPQHLYVYPVGKKLNNNQMDPTSINAIKESIKVQIGKESYGHIKNGTKDRDECVQYFINIFQGDVAHIKPIEEETWCTTYFTASVISESARNFRTFPLILMALDMTRNQDWRQNAFDFLFDQHSMARGGSWIDPSRRGFTGSATPEGSSKLENKGKNRKTKEELMKDLKPVIEIENATFTKWKQTIKVEKNYEAYIDQMILITKYHKIYNDESSIQKFKEECMNFKNETNQEKY